MLLCKLSALIMINYKLVFFPETELKKKKKLLLYCFIYSYSTDDHQKYISKISNCYCTAKSAKRLIKINICTAKKYSSHDYSKPVLKVAYLNHIMKPCIKNIQVFKQFSTLPSSPAL